MENMNNQGKRPQQYEDSARFAWYGVIGIIVIFLSLTLCGCSTTHETSKKCCESKKTQTK